MDCKGENKPEKGSFVYRINFGKLEGVSLNEGWGLMPDPMGRAERQRWWAVQRTPGEFFPSYDDQAFMPTRVPGSFNRVHPELELYEGTVVYLNHFSARLPTDDERALLHFEAVTDRCQVFLNGQLLGAHDTGYTPFTLDATAALGKENRLLVIVNNQRREDHAPGLMHDWLHDGGIHRPVSLHYRPRTFVRDVAVRTRLTQTHVQLECRVLAEAPRRDDRLHAEVRMTDPSTGESLARAALPCEAGAWGVQQIELPREQVRLWSPDDPHLYEVEVTLGEDRWHDTVGLREVRTRGRSILINGEPTVLRGVSMTTDDPTCGAFSLSAGAAHEAVAVMRDLGCNFARAGHRPPSTALVRACDEAGILLWLEVPAYWQRLMHEPGPRRTALHALECMVAAHRNAASVIIWSVGNECLVHQPAEAQSNLSYFLEAVDMLHEMEPTRLVSYAGGIEGTGDVAVERDLPEVIVDKLDVLAINSYSGIHTGTDDAGPLARFDDHRRKARSLADRDKPVIISEAGVDGVRGVDAFDYGEQRQADYHQRLQSMFSELVERDELQGLCIFALQDYRTPIKLARPQGGYNRKGLLTEAGERKAAYDVVRRGYGAVRERAGERVAAHSDRT